VARRPDKLAALVDELAPLAARHGRALLGVAMAGDANWRAAIDAASPGAFDDVIVVAPGEEAMRLAAPLVADGGLLIGFAGTRAGEVVELPLGRLVDDGVSVTASSGSTVADQQCVIAHTLSGTLSPDLLIAAVGGFPATKDAVAAVLAGRFSGKVMILPALDWPLMTLGELFAARPELKPLAGPGLSWSKAIEDAVLDS
jgi:threonine dehydrogenase-like Zn-dependent dehydrogenase